MTAQKITLKASVVDTRESVVIVYRDGQGLATVCEVFSGGERVFPAKGSGPAVRLHITTFLSRYEWIAARNAIDEAFTAFHDERAKAMIEAALLADDEKP